MSRSKLVPLRSNTKESYYHQEPLLFESKLIPPKQPRFLVSRPNIVSSISHGLERKLTLVVAPAGFGKTTAVLEWLKDTGASVAWLSMEYGENQPVLFLRYLIAALQRHQPSLGHFTLQQLDDVQLPPWRRLLGPLLNEMYSLEELPVLVLDDYHVITEPIVDEMLEILVQHSPPNFSILVTSRTRPRWPLIRWKTKLDYTEIGPGQLRFTTEQSHHLFQKAHSLTLSLEEVKQLTERTEGWVTALHLIGLSMMQSSTPQQVLEGFHGEHRLISDFLMEETFVELPFERQSFLMETSSLQRMTPELCDIVRGEKNSDEILCSMENDNLFLITLDSYRQSYRYHHLFRDWLQRRFSKVAFEQWRTTHRRAAKWYALRSRTHEALHHSFAIDDYEQAALWLTEWIPEQARQYKLAPLLAWLPKLPKHKWLEHPHLALYYILWFAQQKNELTNVKSIIQEVLGEMKRILNSHEQDLVRSFPEPLHRGSFLALQAWQARFQRELKSSVSYAQKAVELLPKKHKFLQIEAQFFASRLVLQLQGASKEWVEEMSQSWDEALSHSDLYHLPMFAEVLTRVHVVRGELSQVFAKSKRTLKALVTLSPIPDSPPPVAASLYQALGEAAYYQNQLEQAETDFKEAIRLAQAVGNGRILLNAKVNLARTRWALGQHAQAFPLLDLFEELPTYASTLNLWDRARAMQLILKWGDTERFERWAHEQHLAQQRTFRFGTILDGIVWLNWLIINKQDEEAEDLLPPILQACKLFQSHLFHWEASLLHAQMLFQSGRRDEALPVLLEVLEYSHSEGNLRLFLDATPSMLPLLQYAKVNAQGERWNMLSLHIDQLLSLMDHTPKSKPRPPTPSAQERNHHRLEGLSKDIYELDPLSPREIEVLEYLALGYTNKEVAQQLHISATTVKTHTRNIYSKLNVNNRTRAVQQARWLHVIA